MKLPRRLPLSFAAFFCIALALNDACAQSETCAWAFLTVRTGPLAAGGRQMEEGINLLLKERNYAFAGRKVDIIFADTAGQPALRENEDAGAHRARESHVIIGPLATFEALAIDDYNHAVESTLITPTSAAQMDLAQQKKERLRDSTCNGTAAQPMHVLGQYAAKTPRLEAHRMIADDFTLRPRRRRGFHRVFEDKRRPRRAETLAALSTSPSTAPTSGRSRTSGRRHAGFAGSNPPALPARLQGVRPEEPRVRQPDSGRRRDPQEHGRRSASACTRRAGIRWTATRQTTDVSCRRSAPSTR